MTVPLTEVTFSSRNQVLHFRQLTPFSGIFEFVKTVVDDDKNHFGLKSADESVKKEVMAKLMKGT